MSLLTIKPLVGPDPDVGTDNPAPQVIIVKTQAGEMVRGLSKSDFQIVPQESPFWGNTGTPVGLELNDVQASWPGWYLLYLSTHWWDWKPGHYEYYLDIDRFRLTGFNQVQEDQGGRLISFDVA